MFYKHGHQNTPNKHRRRCCAVCRIIFIFFTPFLGKCDIFNIYWNKQKIQSKYLSWCFGYRPQEAEQLQEYTSCTTRYSVKQPFFNDTFHNSNELSGHFYLKKKWKLKKNEKVDYELDWSCNFPSLAKQGYSFVAILALQQFESI